MTRVSRQLARARKRKKERGIALIMVLGAITILTVFLTELQTDTTSAVAGALAERDRLKAEYYAKSAVNLSRMLLASEKPIRTSIGPMLQLLLQAQKAPQIPVWEFSDRILGGFNGGDRATVFGSTVGADITTGKNMGIPGKGYFDVVIVDEDSKFNLNVAGGASPPVQLIQQLSTLLGQPQYQTMFESPDADQQQSDAATLCAALIDWADPDENLTNCADVTRPASGTEDNIYQMLGLGYVRKNAPFDSLEEVRLVRGMDDDRWATFIDPEPADAHKRQITVWGQTAVNVNSAPPAVLWAATCALATLDTPICSDPLQAAAFLQVFTLVRSFGRGVPIFPTRATFLSALKGTGVVGQFLASLGVSPVTWDPVRGTSKMRRASFTAESKVFSIYAEGVVPGPQREARVRVHTVVDMRQATGWGQTGGSGGSGGSGGAGGAGGAASEAAEAAAESQASDLDFAQEWASNPFGSVVYYRVD